MNLRELMAILRKDVLSLLPLVTLTALLFLGDAIITRLDLLPVWNSYGSAVLLVSAMVLVLAVFQLDSPASLTDDWLCRPVRVRELLAAKFALLICAIHLPRALGAFATDLALGLPALAALQDALLLPDKLFPLLLLCFLFAAIVTRTFVQGFGVLFMIFICVFVLPTPFVRPPGPLDLGIRDALLVNGMSWLAIIPAQFAAAAMLVAGFWLAYRRRRLFAARLLMACTALITVLLVVLPMGLAPWPVTFAAQRAFAPSSTQAASRVSLRHPRQCFPAARVTEISSDGAFVTAARGLGSWDSDVLDALAPGSVAFVTALEPRGLPPDWRVKINHAQARYSSGGITRHTLRPSNHITDDRGGSLLRHSWMLPEAAVHDLRLAGPQLELELSYSLTVLEPRVHRLAIDGGWHALDGLGACRATREPGDSIGVQCFSAFSSAAQISAELDDIPASRVYGGVDLTPAFASWPYGRRTALSIGAARLRDSGTITVIAWRVAAYIDESLMLPGVLGADLTRCPLPGDVAGTSRQARWRDTATHQVNSIVVDDGVRLEVLDFGGAGSPVVLLPGLGATAHSFDAIAPELARHHRVVAITRRGTGYSSKPDFGFDTARLGQDVLAVIDELGLRKPLLVGHSIAGEELTWLGVHHAARFSGLVYLDAAYDRASERGSARSARLRELNRSLPPEPPLPPEALLDYDAMTRHLVARGHSIYPEGELIAFLNVDKPHLALTPSIEAHVQQAIMAATQKPEYEKVRLPALAIYAFADPDAPPPPWYDTTDTQLSATLAEIRTLGDAIKRDNIAAFRAGMARGRVIEMPRASHYIIQSNPREVLEAIEKFAAELPAN